MWTDPTWGASRDAVQGWVDRREKTAKTVFLVLVGAKSVLEVQEIGNELKRPLKREGYERFWCNARVGGCDGDV